MDVKLKACDVTYTLTVSSTQTDHIDTSNKKIIVHAVPLVNYEDPKWYLNALILPKAQKLLTEAVKYESDKKRKNKNLM